MLKKHDGQALVEFVILLPIFIFMIFAVIDFGKIWSIANNLESRMDDVVTLYKENSSLEIIENDLNLKTDSIALEIQEEEKTTNIFLKKEVDIITPGLNLILKNPYEAKVKRVIYNE